MCNYFQANRHVSVVRCMLLPSTAHIPRTFQDARGIMISEAGSFAVRFGSAKNRTDWFPAPYPCMPGLLNLSAYCVRGLALIQDNPAELCKASKATHVVSLRGVPLGFALECPADLAGSGTALPVNGWVIVPRVTTLDVPEMKPRPTVQIHPKLNQIVFSTHKILAQYKVLPALALYFRKIRNMIMLVVHGSYKKKEKMAFVGL